MPTATPARTERSRPFIWLAAGVVVALAAGIAAIVIAVRGGTEGPLVVPVPGHPADIAVTPEAIWVTAPRSGLVWALDPDSGRRLDPALRTGGTPSRLAAGAESLWVVDTAAARLIPVQRRRQQAFIAATPFGPIGVGADATDAAVAGGAVWVLSSSEGIVRAIEPGGRGVRRLRVGDDPVDLAAGGRWVVAAAPGSRTLARIDAEARRLAGPPIDVGGVPAAVALTGSTAWVADVSSGTVVRVNLDAGERRGAPIPVGSRPVAVAADGDDVYVLCRGDRTLVHLDGAHSEVLSREEVGADAAAVALDPRHVWVVDSGAEEVLRFDR
jgi:DNA-binding beta-propeller fold protein YncE